MFKKLSFFALVALAAVSCNNKESHAECQVPVNVHLYGLSVSQEEFDETKAVLKGGSVCVGCRGRHPILSVGIL